MKLLERLLAHISPFGSPDTRSGSLHDMEMDDAALLTKQSCIQHFQVVTPGTLRDNRRTQGTPGPLPGTGLQDFKI